MIRLIGISNPRAAQAFIDYMASRQIHVQMQAEDEQTFGIYLAEPEHQVETEAELKAFLNNPADAKYQAASWQMAESRTASFRYPKTNGFRAFLQRGGPITFLILTLCLGVYLEMQFGNAQQLFDWLHFPADAKQYSQWWRIFTPALMHFSELHLIFNLLWWYLLGGQIEKRCGSLKLLAIFVLSAWGSGFAQNWFEGANFGGLSGVVYALLGYLWTMSRLAPSRGLGIDLSYVGLMLVWMVIGFYEPFNLAIANMAHLFGLLSGCLLGWLDAKFSRAKSV